MKITFLGAARQVTGSMHLVTLQSGYKILIDCGMDYELKRNPVFKEDIFPFNAADIDAVILTHAHIDHSGNLPSLVLQGFRGKIICTSATAELVEYLLYDSANIQLMEYRKGLGNAKKTKRNMVAKPLYLASQVKDTVAQFYTVPFDTPFTLNQEAEVTLIEAGHLLGAASVKLSVNENGKTKTIGFTGDLGRSDSKLVNNAKVLNGIDCLVSECTYGGRKHKITQSAEEEMLHYITSTCINIRGRLVIPAFSVGRTQSIVFTIHQLKHAGLIPHVKIFVDSPLAIRSTRVYEKNIDLLNPEAAQFQKEVGSLFEFEDVKFLEDYNHHEELLYYPDPCVIISAAGMVEGGRIQEHVMNNIENPFSTILIAGFCAEGTLGHRLLQGQPNIRIKNKDKRVFAKIASTDIFSSHPDCDEIFNYIKQTHDGGSKQVFLVHGDETQMTAMYDRLKANGIENVTMPEQGQEFIL
ncbi:MAG: MBL fold metallo-hydrolase [Bacteroidota bacterium]